MKVLTRFSLILCFTLNFSLSQEKESEADPRLTGFLSEIKQAREASNSGELARTAKYIGDLKKLEKKIQATGELDNVLQVVKEREAWEAGKPTPPINPKDKGVPLDLRKLRYYYEKDLITVRAADAKNLKKQNLLIAGKLRELVKTLTTEGKIPQAIETRKIKKQLIEGSLVFDGEEMSTKTEVAAVTENETKSLAGIKPDAAVMKKPTPTPEPEIKKLATPIPPPIKSHEEGAKLIMRWVALGNAYAVINDGVGKNKKIYGSAELPRRNFALLEVKASSDCGDHFPWHALPSVPELRTLILHFQTSVTAEDLSHLAESEKLANLQITKSQFTENAIEGLPELPALKRLGITFGKGNSPNWISKLHIHNSHIQHLTFGSVQPAQFTSKDLTEFAQFKDLKTLSIDFTANFDAESVAALGKLRHLSSLGLFKNTTFAPGTIQGIEEWSKFRTLRLKQCKENLYNSIPAFLELKNLEYLGIAYSSLTDEHLGVIADNAGKSLETLQLGHTKNITDEGIAKLASMQNLKSIQIYGANKLSAEGVEALGEKLSRCDINYSK